jgi:hypothetical protein
MRDAASILLRCYLSWYWAGMVADQYRAHGVGAAFLILGAISITITIIGSVRRNIERL